MREIRITDECIIYNDMPRGWVKGKAQPKWHYALYSRWWLMWRRCKNPKDKEYTKYKDCEIDERYRLFSNYINDIMQLENFDKLCDDLDNWEIDKDTKNPNSRHYYFENLSIISSYDNMKEQLNRNKNMNFIPIRGVHKDNGSVIIFNTREEFDKSNFSISHINECLEGKRKTHGKYKWEYLIYDK